jgi:hypothetical protein
VTTWDVRDRAGQIVTDLSGLAEALDTSPEQAVKHLLSNPVLTAAAPASLLADVKASAKPGDGTPPPVSNGSFVSFRGGKGRVDLIVRKGKVPGVPDDVEATADSPAARVVVWKDGKATREKRAFSTHTLKRIAPLDKPEKKSGLVALAAQHDHACLSMGLPDHARITGVSVKTAYDRGWEAYPVGRTSLSREEWALARAEHFVKVAAGTVSAERAGHDVDLLHPDHPLRQRDRDKVYVNADDLDATVKALLEAARD